MAYMQLSHGTRFNGVFRNGDRLRDGEPRGIYDLDRSSVQFLRRDLRQWVGKRLGNLALRV